MHTLFLVCFGVGVGYVLIGFFIGEIAGHFDFSGGHMDADHLDLHGNVSPLKPSVIASFLTVFGGVGLIFLKRTDEIFAFFIAFASGFLLAYIFYRWIIVPLYKAQNTSVVEKQSLVGHVATITEFVPQGGFGKITYFVNGNTYSAPSKSEDGAEIQRGTIVEIIYIEKNLFYIRRKI